MLVASHLVRLFGDRVAVDDVSFTVARGEVFGLLGPNGALQMTIAISSRVNDPRSAQQLAVLIVLPLVLMLVGQIAGAFLVPTSLLLVVALVLAIAWGFLILLSVALFERETILTRWKGF